MTQGGEPVTLLTTADERAARLDELSTDLEVRVANLGPVEKRLGDFEERLSRWDAVDRIRLQ